MSFTNKTLLNTSAVEISIFFSKFMSMLALATIFSFRQVCCQFMTSTTHPISLRVNSSVFGSVFVSINTMIFASSLADKFRQFFGIIFSADSTWPIDSFFKRRELVSSKAMRFIIYNLETINFSKISKIIFFPFNMASKASSSFSIFIKKNIFRRITMAVLTKFGSSSVAPFHVYFMSNSLEVIRIYAGRIAAKVIKLQAIRDFSFMEYVRKPMGILRFSIMPKSAIWHFRIFSSGPYPATRSFVYLRKKSFQIPFLSSFDIHSIASLRKEYNVYQ